MLEIKISTWQYNALCRQHSTNLFFPPATFEKKEEREKEKKDINKERRRSANDDPLWSTNIVLKYFLPYCWNDLTRRRTFLFPSKYVEYGQKGVM